jgi:hypothetical protein
VSISDPLDVLVDVDIEFVLVWFLNWTIANLQRDPRLMCAWSSVTSLSNSSIRGPCVRETTWDPICRERRADASDECMNRLRMFGLVFSYI